MDAIGKEGYKVMVNEELKITFVVGHDPRGVLSSISLKT